MNDSYVGIGSNEPVYRIPPVSHPKAPKCFGITNRKTRRANKCQKNCPSFKQCGDKHAEMEKI